MRVAQNKPVPLRVFPALPMNESKANLCFRGVGDIRVLRPSNLPAKRGNATWCD